MRVLVPILTWIFRAVQTLATLLASPLTFACVAGLLIFTYLIAWRVRMEARGGYARALAPNARA